MKKQLLAVTGALAMAASLSYAVQFDSSSGTDPVPVFVGTTPGFDSSSGGPVVIRAGAARDYNSLAETAAAFSAVPGGINRPYIVYLSNDSSETSLSFFGNTFGPTGSLTIKPLPGTQPTITFTTNTAPLGIYGCVVFGVSDGNVVTAANDRPSSGSYVLDGSSTPGGTTRDLTFIIPNTANDATGNLIRVWGDTKNMVIKNMRLINRDASGNGHVIGIGDGVTSEGTVRKVDGLIIDNCYLEGKAAGTQSVAVNYSFGANGVLPAGYCSENIVIRNCEIHVKNRGIFLGASSGIIENNSVFNDQGTGTGMIYAGIFANDNNKTFGGTMIIRNNVVSIPVNPNVTAAQGSIGIYVETGMAGTSFEISNNILRDFAFTGASAADQMYRGISFGLSTPGVIEHNSLNLPPSSKVTGATAGRVAGIVDMASTTYTLTVRNNIVKMGNAGAGAACVTYAAAGTGGTVVSVGNDLVPNGTPNVGRYGSNAYATLDAWQAAGFDTAATGGQSVDPATVNPAWDANLHFALKPVGLGTVASSTVLTDVDGDPRPATGAYPGADEPPGPPASVADWAIF
jgi:hypothetical protein